MEGQIAHVICVTLIGPPAVSAGAANAVSCVAFVQWGAGEAEAEAEIDFGIGGVVFTLPASAIRITAEYEGNFATGESPQPIRVGAFASVGSGAARPPASACPQAQEGRPGARLRRRAPGAGI